MFLKFTENFMSVISLYFPINIVKALIRTVQARVFVPFLQQGRSLQNRSDFAQFP